VARSNHRSGHTPGGHVMSLRPHAPWAIPTAPPAWLPYLRFEIQPDALRLVYYRHET
jgi:hypothetical protein